MNIPCAYKAVLALVLSASFGCAAANPTDLSSAQEAPGCELSKSPPIGTGFFSMHVSKNDPAYSWIESLVGPRVLADTIALTVEYPADELGLSGGAALQEAILGAGKTPGSRSKYIVPNGAPPEGPGRIGEDTTTESLCTEIRIGGTTDIGDVEYEWEYRYTVDTSRDGENDSNPEWVLVGFKVKFLFETQSLCV